jgi:hypothetical protein
MGGQSPSNITAHLKGIHFPARKRDLITQAQKNRAEADVLDMLQGLPDTDYRSITDVMAEYGRKR